MKKGLTTLLFTFMVTMAMGQGMVEGYNDFINQAKAGDANAQYYIGLFYPSTQALEEAKGVIREKLEVDLKELAEKLDKFFVK